MDKKRQFLPLMSKLKIKIDQERLLKEFYDLGYNNWDLYNGLKSDYASENGRIVRQILLNYFLSDEEKKQKKEDHIIDGGEAYKMLCLTDYDEKEAGNKLDEIKLSEKNPEMLSKAKMLEKIHDRGHKHYIPEADERNYTKRNEYAKGYFNEVMDMFKGKVTRTRLAVLQPGEEIKPHIDVNTDLGIRIHIPVITNNKVIVGVRGKNKNIEENMKADGSVYFLNQGFTHYVKNNGETPRVHFVMSIVGQDDIQDNEWEIWDTSQ